ncbi:MAG: immunoglobulin domain-containing protein [Candidatus Kapabacteria bacterium]|nr:immunoglobulin domain-containing protein [Candidatus Kapabacteria bacterium]
MSKFLKTALVLILIGFGALKAQTFLSQNFEGGAFPSGWYNSYSTSCQITTSGFSPNTASPHGGSYMLGWYNYNYGSAYAITTAMDFTGYGGRVVVGFWMYRDTYVNDVNDRMEVYVNTSQAAGGTLLGTVYRRNDLSPAVASAGWYYYSFPIPSSYNGVAYVNFSDVSPSYWGNIYIDDISIYVAANEAYASSAGASASSAVVVPGATGKAVVQAQINVTGEVTPISVTNLTFNTNGTTVPANVTSAKLYYTGTSNNFATTTLLGTVVNPSGAISFTINQALAGGPGTTTNYFWLAYDVSASAPLGNYIGGTFNSVTVGGSTYSPSNQGPYQRLIAGPMSGNYTIGSGGNYPNLTAAIADILGRTLSANTTLTLISNVTEPTTVTITKIPYTGVGPYTLTITTAGSYTLDANVGSTTSASAASANAVIYLQGCSYITIDGTPSRLLTIRNNSNPASSLYYYMYGIAGYNVSTTNYLTNITIQNCNVTTANTTTYNYWYPIYLYGYTASTLAPFNNINIINNYITGQGTWSSGYYYYGYGIYLYSYYSNNCNISNNTLYNIGYYGIYWYNASTSTNLSISGNWVRNTFYYSLYCAANSMTNLNITNNTIGDINGGTNTAGFYGMYLSGSWMGTTNNVNYNTINNLGNNWYTTTAPRAFNFLASTASTVNGTTIAFNKINKIWGQYPSYGGAHGMYIAGGYGTNIHDNLITDITGMNNGGSAINVSYYSAQGITLASGYGTKLYNNTVNMATANLNSGTTASASAALFIYSYSSTTYPYDIRNNIFHNTMTHWVAGSKSYAVYAATTNTAWTICDYNDLYAGGNYPVLSYYMTLYNGTYDQLTLANWQGSTLRDANSSSVPVTFMSGTDGHLNGSSAVDYRIAKCPVLAAAPTDIDGRARKAITNMGIDEAYPMGFNMSQNLMAVPNSAVFCTPSAANLNFVISYTGFEDGIGRSAGTPVYNTTWYKGQPSTGIYNPIAGQTQSTLSFPAIAQSDSANYYATVKYDMTGFNTTTQQRFMKVESQMSFLSHPASAEQCSTNPTLLISSTYAGTVYGMQWQIENPVGSGNYTDMAGQNTTTLNLTFPDPHQAAGKYRLKITGPGNCGLATMYSNVATIVITDPIVNNKITHDIPSDPGHACTGTDFRFTCNAIGTIYAYEWQYRPNTSSNFATMDQSINPSAATKTLYTFNPQITHSGQYRCLVYGSLACQPNQFSDTLTVKVWNPFTIVNEPTDFMVCQNVNPATNRIDMFVVGDGTIYKYQWQKDGADILLTTNPTANNSHFITNSGSFDNGGVYRCKISVEDCRNKVDVYTRDAVIFIERKTQITTQPVTANANIGESISFQVGAQAIDDWMARPTLPVTVQWYKMKNNVATAMVDDKRIAGSKSSLLHIQNIVADDYTYTYYVVVVGLCGTDKSVSVNIQQGPGVNISGQPGDVNSCATMQASFKVTAATTGSGKILTYQWKFNSKAISNGVKYAGTTTANLSINNVDPTDVGNYSCVVTVDGVNSVESSAGKLAVNILPTITTQPPAKLDVQTGKDITITIVAAGTTPLTYVWSHNAIPMPLQTSATLQITGATASDAGVYGCKVSNICGDVLATETQVNVTYENKLSVTDKNLIPHYVAPNPINEIGYIYVCPTGTKKINVRLFDALGKQVAELFNSVIENNQMILVNASVLNLTNGVYFYTISDENGFTVTDKLEIIR